MWGLLGFYGLDGVVGGQYALTGGSPNCALCPLAPREYLERAARLLPTGFLVEAAAALGAWMGSGRARGPGRRLAERLLGVVEGELERRRRRE